MLSVSRLNVTPPAVGENKPYRISVQSSEGTTLSTFQISLASKSFTDPFPRFAATADGATLVAIVSTGNTDSFNVKFSDNGQSTLRDVSQMGHGTDAVKLMRVVNSPSGPLAIFLYEDNTLDVINGRTGLKDTFKIRMNSAGSILADLNRDVLYLRGPDENTPRQNNETIEMLDLFAAIAQLPLSGKPFDGQPMPEPVPVSASVTSAETTPVHLTETRTLPTATGGRIDFEERAINGTDTLCAVVKDKDGSEQSQPIPIRFGEGPVHAEFLPLKPDQVVVTREGERQVIDLATGRVYVRLSYAGPPYSGGKVISLVDHQHLRERFYQTDRYVVTELVFVGSPENNKIETLLVRDLRKSGVPMVYKLNEFGDTYDSYGVLLDLRTCPGRLVGSYGRYKVVAFPVTTPDWTHAIQVVQLYDTNTNQIVAQVTLEDDTGQYSGILLRTVDIMELKGYSDRPDRIYFTPYNATEPTPRDIEFLLNGMWSKEKAYFKTLAELFPNVSGLEPPGILQTVETANGTVVLERNLYGGLQIVVKNPQTGEVLSAPIDFRFGAGNAILSSVENHPELVYLTRGTERQILDCSIQKTFASLGTFRLYGEPNCTPSEENGKLLIRSYAWRDAKPFTVQRRGESVFGQYKVVTTVLVSDDGINTVSIVQLYDSATGGFLDQKALVPGEKNSVGITMPENPIGPRPDILRFARQIQVTENGVVRVVADPNGAFQRSLRDLFPQRTGLDPSAGILQTLRVNTTPGYVVHLVQTQDGLQEIHIKDKDDLRLLYPPIPFLSGTIAGVVRMTEASYPNFIRVAVAENGEYQEIDLTSGRVAAQLPGFTFYQTDRYKLSAFNRGGKSVEHMYRDSMDPTNPMEPKSLSLRSGTTVNEFDYGDYHIRMADLLSRDWVYLPPLPIQAPPPCNRILGYIAQGHWEERRPMAVFQLFDKQGNFLEQVILEGERTQNADSSKVFFTALVGSANALRPDLIRFTQREAGESWMTIDTPQAFVRSLADLFPRQSQALGRPSSIIASYRDSEKSKLVVDVRRSEDDLQEVVVTIANKELPLVTRMPSIAGPLTITPVTGQPQAVEIAGSEERVFLDTVKGELFVEVDGVRMVSNNSFWFSLGVPDAAKSSLYIRDPYLGNQRFTATVAAPMEQTYYGSYKLRIWNVSWNNGQRSMPSVAIYDNQNNLLGQTNVNPGEAGPGYSGIVVPNESLHAGAAGPRFVPLGADGAPDTSQAFSRTLRDLFPDVTGLPMLGVLQQIQINVNGRAAIAQIVATVQNVELVVKFVSDGALAFPSVPIIRLNSFNTYALSYTANRPNQLSVTRDGDHRQFLDLDTGKLMVPKGDVRFYCEGWTTGLYSWVNPQGDPDAINPGTSDDRGGLSLFSLDPSNPVQRMKYQGYDVVLITIKYSPTSIVGFVQLYDPQGHFVRQVVLGGCSGLSAYPTPIPGTIQYLSSGQGVSTKSLAELFPELFYLRSIPPLNVSVRGCDATVYVVPTANGGLAIAVRYPSNGRSPYGSFNIPLPSGTPDSTVTMNTSVNGLNVVVDNNPAQIIELSSGQLVSDALRVRVNNRDAIVCLVPIAGGRAAIEVRDISNGNLLYSAVFLPSAVTGTYGLIYDSNTPANIVVTLNGAPFDSFVLHSGNLLRQYLNITVNERQVVACIGSSGNGLYLKLIDFSDESFSFTLPIPGSAASSICAMTAPVDKPGELLITVSGNKTYRFDLNYRIFFINKIDVQVSGHDAVAFLVPNASGGVSLTIRYISDGTPAFPDIAIPGGTATSTYSMTAGPEELVVTVDGTNSYRVILNNGIFSLKETNVKVLGRDAVAFLVPAANGGVSLTVKYADGTLAFSVTPIQGGTSTSIYEMTFDATNPRRLIVSVDGKSQIIDLFAEGRPIVAEKNIRVRGADAVALLVEVNGSLSVIVKYLSNGTLAYPVVPLNRSMRTGTYSLECYGNSPGLLFAWGPEGRIGVIILHSGHLTYKFGSVQLNGRDAIAYYTGNNSEDLQVNVAYVSDGTRAFLPVGLPPNLKKLMSGPMEYFAFDYRTDSQNRLYITFPRADEATFSLPLGRFTNQTRFVKNVLDGWAKSLDHGLMPVEWNAQEKFYKLGTTDWAGGEMSSNEAINGRQYARVLVKNNTSGAGHVSLELKDADNRQLLGDKQRLDVPGDGAWHVRQIEIPADCRNGAVHYIAFSDAEGEILVKAITLESQAMETVPDSAKAQLGAMPMIPVDAIGVFDASL